MIAKTSKQKIIEMLERLPADIDYARAMEGIQVLQKVEVGLAQVERGAVYDDEDVERELALDESLDAFGTNMAAMVRSNKEKIEAVIEQLPVDVDIAEAIYRLELLRRVEIAHGQDERGEFIDDADLEKWLVRNKPKAEDLPSSMATN